MLSEPSKSWDTVITATMHYTLNVEQLRPRTPKEDKSKWMNSWSRPPHHLYHWCLPLICVCVYTQAHMCMWIIFKRFLQPVDSLGRKAWYKDGLTYYIGAIYVTLKCGALKVIRINFSLPIASHSTIHLPCGEISFLRWEHSQSPGKWQMGWLVGHGPGRSTVGILGEWRCGKKMWDGTQSTWIYIAHLCQPKTSLQKRH